MKAIIDRRLAFRFPVPVIDTLEKRLPFVLNREVDNGGCASMGSGAGDGEKIIGRLRPAEGQFHVLMRIDAAGYHEFSGSIDNLVGLHLELGADNGNLLILDQNIGSVIVGGSDDTAVKD